MRIGSLNGASLYYKGWYQDVVMLDRSLSATEVRRVVEYAPAGGIKHIAVLGDSISASMTATTGWLYYVANEYNSSKVGVYKHALSGHSIMANMDTQTAEAASDNADSIIVALGTNDNDAGDMGALQAEYAENLAELRASNPGATVYAMNVLPRWTDVGGGTPVAKDNIRVAIAAACTAQGVTCWDTYTDPWLVAGDTSDGTHPTAAGAAAIAARVLALLP
jgi:lysophospholipase L1-like esterase